LAIIYSSYGSQAYIHQGLDFFQSKLDYDSSIDSLYDLVPVTSVSNAGNTNIDAVKANAIIVAVRIPYDENKGIGANPITAKPPMDEPADASNATPVPLAALRTASIGRIDLFISSLKRSVI
tara:strand:+ start:131 stop:496 length:366 start_codon:yes stop_codon:yes gene_type:complete